MENDFYFNEECIENVRHYRYLGVHFSASGVFNFAIDDIFKKSIKATFKLTKLTTTGEPSIKSSLRLYDHLIKPIVLYGSEIWGSFKTNSSACNNLVVLYLKRFIGVIILLQISHRCNI